MGEQAVNNQIQQPNISTPSGPKPHSFLTNKLFLITLLIAVLFILVYAGIYLNLNSQLNEITKRNQPPQITHSLPSPTPLPAEASAKEGDPTANWKTLMNANLGFTLKYPNNWIRPYPGDPEGIVATYQLNTPDLMEYDPGLPGGYILGVQRGVRLYVEVIENAKFRTRYVKSFQDLKRYQEEENESRYSSWINIEFSTGQESILDKERAIMQTLMLIGKDEHRSIQWYMSVIYALHNGRTYQLEMSSLEREDTLFTQILSTFKFTDKEGQVVCTQDAKLCPDGSYVSRQPPTCEFAACPQK